MCVQFGRSGCQCGIGIKRQLLMLFCCCVLLAVVSDAEFLSEEECYVNGEEVVLQCKAVIGPGFVVVWRSEPIETADFNCPNMENSAENSAITISNECPSSLPLIGTCSLVYMGILSCDTYMSTLTFNSNYSSMNGGLIQCHFVSGLPLEPTSSNISFPLKIGIVPNLPMNATLSFPEDRVCRYDWLPPEGFVVGGIFGYNISYDGKCGDCKPEGVVSNTILTAACSNWTASGQNCSAFIRTVTADCKFESEPAILYSRLDNTAPTDIVVTVICSNNTDNPDVQVKWNYTLPFAEPSRLIPGVFGFLVNISNQQSNKNVSTFLNDSDARSYVFSSTSLQQAGLEGDVITIVTVVTQVGRFHNNLTFSLEGIMTDISSTLMIRQCIEVSINQQCNESADSFQAQLQFADGVCGESTLNKTTENLTLQHDYETCIPVGTDPICFSAVMFYNNGMEVARTGSQELNLLQCNTSYISSVYNNGVTVTNSTTMEVVLQGTKVLHNTVLSFQCALLCKLMGTNTTRCVNGTFESLLNESSHCDCGQRTNVIAGTSVGGPVIIVAVIIIIIIICTVKEKKRNVPS